MIIVEQSFEIETPDVFFDYMTKSIEKAGRTCYLSFEKTGENTDEKFIRMIIDRGHESVLEHMSISVRIICDRGVSHELVRHRIASFSQESTRYCDYGGNGIRLIHPEGLSEAQIMRRTNLYWHVQEVYDTERREGISPQIARGVLPNSLKTELVMTCNLREWRHFFKLRCSRAAHPQMREITVPMLTEFYERLPSVFGDLE